MPFIPEYEMRKSAVMSDDGVYRYALRRQWGPGRAMLWVMLNPSTADGVHDDPTVRRCYGFSRAWGYHGFEVVNLFAYRATDPRELRRAADPIGPNNYRVIAEVAARHHSAIVAWGDRVKPFHGRTAAVLKILRAADVDVLCLGLTGIGNPRHPLYVAATTRPGRF